MTTAGRAGCSLPRVVREGTRSTRFAFGVRASPGEVSGGEWPLRDRVAECSVRSLTRRRALSPVAGTRVTGRSGVRSDTARASALPTDPLVGGSPRPPPRRRTQQNRDLPRRGGRSATLPGPRYAMPPTGRSRQPPSPSPLRPRAPRRASARLRERTAPPPPEDQLPAPGTPRRPPPRRAACPTPLQRLR
jgi:hypothetical protein